MNTLLLVHIFFIFAAVLVCFGMLVWPGIDNVDIWVIYVSMAIAAFGGGAAINLVFSGIPK